MDNSAEPLTVTLTREPFMPWVMLTLPDGTSEELEAEEARAWFRRRGASMDAVEAALDDVWNFCESVVIIQKPRVVPVVYSRTDPKI